MILRCAVIIAAALLVSGCEGHVKSLLGSPREEIRAHILRASPPPAPARSAQASAQTAGGEQSAQAQPFKSYGRPPEAVSGRAPLPKGPAVLDDLAFEEADIRDVARVILAEALGADYAIAPEVSGVVTLRMSGPLDRTALLAALEAALNASNAALIEQRRGAGAFYVISAQEGAAARAPLRPAFGHGLQIIRLRHAAAEQMRAVLERALPQGAVLNADAARGVLVLSGSSDEMARVAALVAALDVDALRGRSVGVFPLRAAPAQDVADEIQTLLRLEDLGAADVSVRAAPRLNAILASTRSAAQLDLIEAWARRLDVSASEGAGLEVHRAQYVDAEALASALNALFSGGPAPVAAPGEAEATLGALADKPGLRIVAAPQSGAVLVHGPPALRRAALSALRQLDAAPDQIAIEATVAEVALTQELRYGVQFFLDDILGGEQVGAVLTAGSAASGIAPQLPGFALSLGAPAKLVLDALDGVTDIAVISSPHLVVLDAQTAELNVGAQVPVARRQRQGENAGDALVNTIEFRDTGVLLKVTPRVAGEGAVRLDIEQEVSSVAAGSAGELTPTISTRRFKSRLLARSGATVVLGGLIQSSSTRSKSGVPGLQDAPILGALFGRRGASEDRTELLVMITPKILRAPQDLEAAADELRAGFAALLGEAAD